MEVAKEGSSREKLSKMLLKPVAVGVGRGGPELAHHTQLGCLPIGHNLEPVCYTVTLRTQCFQHPLKALLTISVSLKKLMFYMFIYLL